MVSIYSLICRKTCRAALHPVMVKSQIFIIMTLIHNILVGILHIELVFKKRVRKFNLKPHAYYIYRVAGLIVKGQAAGVHSQFMLMDGTC